MKKIKSILEKELNASGVDLEAVANLSGIPESTLIKIQKGTTQNPTLKNIQPLLNHFGYTVVKSDEVIKRNAKAVNQ